jgi:plastocyanin
MWRKIVIYGVIAAVVYGGIYFVRGSNNKSSAAQQITVTGNEFAFDPAVISLNKGVPVEMVFKNTGKYPHNLVINGLNVQTKVIKQGEQDTVSFTPTTTGQFEYLCTVPGHADKGMTGTLTVN